MPKKFPKRASSQLTKKLQAILPNYDDTANKELVAVVDTNVYISALLGSSTASNALSAIYRQCDIIISQQIIDELCRFIDDNWKKARGLKKLAREVLAERATLFIDADQLDDIWLGDLRDKNDGHIVKACISTNADVLITGDKDLLVLGSIGRTAVITMNDFLGLLGT